MGRNGIASVTVERQTGMDVGCKRDALAAVAGTLPRIGRGLCRTAYADSRQRFVYKIDNAGYEGSNRDEYEAFTSGRLSAMGLGQYGSPVALFTVETPDGPVEVLAMPFRAHGSDHADHGERARARARGMMRLPDMHEGNYRVTANGRIKITDLGFGIDGRGW